MKIKYAYIIAIITALFALTGCGITQKKFDSLINERDVTKNEITAVSQSVEAIRSELNDIQNELTKKRNELAETNDNLKQANEEIKSKTETMENSLDDLNLIQNTLQSLEDEAAGLQEEIDIKITSVTENIIVLHPVFNGAPFSKVDTGSWIHLWGTESGRFIPSLPIDYYPESSSLVIRGLDYGNYNVHAMFDTDNDRDSSISPYLIFTGDYKFTKQLVVPEDPIILIAEFPGVKGIHLTSPVDSAEIQSKIVDGEYPLVLPGNIRFEYEAIDGASYYSIQIWQIDMTTTTPTRTLVVDEQTSSTYLEVKLDINQFGTNYYMKMTAWGTSGNIGVCFYQGENWWGESLAFRVQ